jgi:SAM-dependent methyltransferase
MLAGDTDKTWEYYGKTNPYFGVLTTERFKNENLTSDNKAAFFESGHAYLDFVFQVARENLDSSFRPKRALDFGCGVGRLALPLARQCESVVGVDISDSMLAEARSNCREQGLTNATFVKGDDTLSGVSGSFDLVHSFIVFQHIPPKRGEVILQKLVDLVREDGIGILHFTYSFGTSLSVGRRLLIEGYRRVPGLYSLRNIVKGRPFSEPMMEMNEYSLNALLRRLQESGCHKIAIRFTETGAFGQPFYGAILFFQKKRTDVRAYG